MSSWIKLWNEMLHDPKILSLTDEQHRFWINCLLMAGSLEKQGALGTTEDVAIIARKSVFTTRRLLDVFQRLDMVTSMSRVWLIKNFAKRQHIAPSDRPEAMRERQRKHRATQNKAKYRGRSGVIE